MMDIEAMPAYSAPMREAESGVAIIQDEFFKELIGRVRLMNHDITLRRLSGNSYAIELVVRTIKLQDVSTLVHCETSEQANRYLSIIKEKIKQYVAETNPYLVDKGNRD